MTEDFKYKAFLSYSHQDQKWADWLHRELERYRVPPRLRHAADAEHPIPRNLRPIFRDRAELSSGSSLPQVINDALSYSEFLIVVCSPSAVESEWVNDEIVTFQRLGRGHRILCLIVDGEPLSGDETECFPQALRQPADVDGQPLLSPAEPIAADIRGGRHNQRHALMMLIAGLLETGLDELLQRDLHRRARRLFMIATGAMLIAVVMAGLMIFAFRAQAESERRRADAETLVGFMLGDLREDLHAIGRMDVYGSVAEKAMDYFRSLGKDDARDEVLAQRSEALRQIGSTKLDQGDLSGATEALNESLAISSGLAVKNPSRLDWNLALAESHFWVGYMHWQRGDLEAASKKFVEQLSVVDALAAAEPDNAERLGHSGYAWTNYGRVLELSGLYDEALQAYETVMEIFQRVLVLEPDDVESELEIGFAHNNLGKLKISLGLMDEARLHFLHDLEIKQKVVDEYPSPNTRQEHLAASHYWFGDILQAQGELAVAREQGETALQILDKLLVIDPTVTPWRLRRALVYRQLAANCRMKNESECAAAYIQSALRDLEILMEINPHNARWQRSQCETQLEAAWQAALHRDFDRASNLTEKTLRSLVDLVERASDDRDIRKVETLAKLTFGDLARQTGTPGKATSHWQSALSTLEKHFSLAKDPEVLDLQVRLMARLGRTAQAPQIEAILEQTGYHSSYPQLWPTE